MIHTSPRKIRFADNAIEAEFQRRYHLRAGKHTKAVMLAGTIIFGFSAIRSDNSLWLNLLGLIGPASGWLLCEWKKFHPHAQTIGSLLYIGFFFGLDFLQTQGPQFASGHHTFLAILNVYVVYTMLRMFFVPSILAGLAISVGHIFLLNMVSADAAIIQKAVLGLALANIIGPVISLQFELNFRQMFTAKNDLTREKELQDRLLDNIIPAGLGEKLRLNFEDVFIDCPNVIIISADLANFTAYSSSVNAGKLVQVLNRIYSAFDRLADSYGLTKVKTMGDAIILVSGIQTPATPVACHKMAQAMLVALKKITDEESADLSIRIGIADGSCQAGVVGELRPKFDIWGPALVNAEREEKRAAVGAISISDEVLKLLPDSLQMVKQAS